jgi:signal transduction histidine kinase
MNDETRYENRPITLYSQVARLKETEGLTLAEYLHDEFGPALMVAKMKLELLSDDLPKRFVGSANEIAEIISDLMRRTRGAIQDLASDPACRSGLRAGIASLIDDLQIRHGIVCAAKLDPLLDKFAEEAKYVLYRAVRELLLNIRKHARASRVKINVSRKDSSVKIEVRDNGCGFAGHKPSAPHDSGGFGLSSVRADLTSIGADLLISSRIGRGTRAIIVIPVPL